MTAKHDVPRGPGGRPRDHSLDGTSRARGRTLRDPDPIPTTRGEQLRAALKADGVDPGERLQAFMRGENIDAPMWAMSALCSDYAAFEAHAGKRSALVRSLEPFTDVALDEIRAGTGPNRAPWANLQPS